MILTPRRLTIPPLLQLACALALIGVGQVFIFWENPPLTDYYFILVWSGYILLVDYLVFARVGRSLLRDAPVALALMFPASSAFWWLFEGYNQFVRNWVYLAGDYYEGLLYVAVSTLFFSTVVPAVWSTALLVLTFVGPRAAGTGGRGDGETGREGQAPTGTSREDRGPEALAFHPLPPSPSPPVSPSPSRPLPLWLPALGVVLAILPLFLPTQAFPLVWVGLFVVIDPLNDRAGRPSILRMLLHRQWRVPLAFYVGTTITGFFWEFWNYWAWPKWVYELPAWVEAYPHLFEMPLPGYLGYGPFGWELFAMWWFVVGLWPRARAKGGAPAANPR